MAAARTSALGCMESNRGGTQYKSERLWLVAAIRQKLVPEFLGRGFEVATLSESDDDSADRSLISSFPFGLLRRKTARGFEQIKIELISRRRVAARMNFGVVPAEGINGVHGSCRFA